MTIALMVMSMMAMLTVGPTNSTSNATNVRDVLPAGGVALALEEGTDINSIYVAPTYEEEQAALIAQTMTGNSPSENGFVEAGVEEVLISDIDVSGNDITVSGEMPVSAISGSVVSMASAQGPSNAAATADILARSINVGAVRSVEMREEMDSAVVEVVSQEEKDLDPENFSDLVIAQVSNYVNVRDISVVSKGFYGEEVVGEFVSRPYHRAQTPPVPIENRYQRGIVELLERVLRPEMIRLN